MFDSITDESQLLLLKEKGVWNYKTNKKGVIRDHKYSRYSGWKNKIFPEILRHPCNCEIITHGDNLKKKKGRYADNDSQTLDDLFEKILAYKEDWIEQNICLKLIDDYKKGLRYNKNEYIKKFYENGKY